MNKRTLSLLGGLFSVAIAGAAHADAMLQLWDCELNEGKTRAELREVSVAWTEAARAIEGAEGLEAYLNYPVSGNVGDGEFTFVLVLDSATAWGHYEDGYAESAAADIDDDAWGEVASCSKSRILTSVPLQ